MMLGLGNGTTPTTTGTTQVATPGFTDGLSAWQSPSAALTDLQNALSNASTAFSSTQLPYTAGLLAVPVGALVLLMSLMGGKR